MTEQARGQLQHLTCAACFQTGQEGSSHGRAHGVVGGQLQRPGWASLPGPTHVAWAISAVTDTESDSRYGTGKACSELLLWDVASVLVGFPGTLVRHAQAPS